MNLFFLLALLFRLAAALQATPRRTVNHLAARDSTTRCIPNSSPDPGSICGQPQHPHAGAGDDSKIMYSQYLDFDSCINYCAGVGCPAVSYNSGSRLCNFFGRPLFRSDNSSKVLYYDVVNCFTCSTDCEPSPSANALLNPDFNDSRTQIGPWMTFGHAYELIPNPVGQGRAARFSFTQADEIKTALTFGQYPLVCADQGYLLTVDYNIDQLVKTPAGANLSEGIMSFAINFNDCEQSTVFNWGDERFGRWQSTQCGVRSRLGNSTALAGQGMGVNIVVFEGKTEGSRAVTWNFTLANMRFTRMLPDIVIQGQGASLLQNGGFENGQLQPWTATPSYDGGGTKKPRPCNQNNPLTSIKSPGLPAQANTTQASNYRLSFCGVAPGGYCQPYYGHCQVGTFYFLNQLVVGTVAGKRYVFTMQYNLNGGTNTKMRLTLGQYRGIYAAFIPQGNTNATVVYQGIFIGLGLPANLSIEVSNDVGQYGGFPPLVPLSLEIDNISINELDDG